MDEEGKKEEEGRARARGKARARAWQRRGETTPSLRGKHPGSSAIARPRTPPPRSRHSLRVSPARPPSHLLPAAFLSRRRPPLAPHDLLSSQNGATPALKLGSTVLTVHDSWDSPPIVRFVAGFHALTEHVVFDLSTRGRSMNPACYAWTPRSTGSSRYYLASHSPGLLAAAESSIGQTNLKVSQRMLSHGRGSILP